MLDKHMRPTHFPGVMTLDAYLKKNGLTEEAFGASAGLSQSFVNRLRTGEAKPSAGALERIYAATAGAVTANDLLGMVSKGAAKERVQ